MVFTSKQQQALEMRRAGKTHREIAEALKVSPGRAHALVDRALIVEKRSGWAEGLPPSVAGALFECGIEQLSELRAAVQDGSLARMNGIGPRRYETIIKWLEKQ